MKNFWAILKVLFSKVLQYLVEFIAEALTKSKQVVLSELLELATDVVETLQKTDLSNEEKRKQAFEDIKSLAIDAGIDVKDSLVNLAIELALQKVKA